MRNTFKTLALAGAMSVTGALAASAVTIDVQTYSAANYTTVSGYFIDVPTEQNFDSMSVGEIGVDYTAVLATNVGDFSTSSTENGTGTGNSVIGDGDTLAIREGSNFGRVDTSLAGQGRFLDSNDTLGILWNVATGNLFNRVIFSLSDAADVGATLTIAAGGATRDFSLQPNGVVDLIIITFDSLIANAEIELRNSQLNDGIGIDQISVGAIPLPAGGVLMLSALGGLALARRRKSA